MKKTIGIASLVVLSTCILCACAMSPHGWYKSGVSQYETENAVAQCEYEKGKDHVEQGDFVTNCMKRQGFRWYE